MSYKRKPEILEGHSYRGKVNPQIVKRVDCVYDDAGEKWIDFTIEVNPNPTRPSLKAGTEYTVRWLSFYQWIGEEVTE